ncbi:TPA: hypothetical protein EYP66_07130 [Candidatus Poribacteria bacterium]|nr:hypothetical protein [Candidatus Poribacteria bacterium]
MNRYTLILIAVAIFLVAIYSADAAVPKIAFIHMGDDGPFTKPALEFAKKAFDTKQLTRKQLTSTDLTQFAVVWWHDGDTDPGALTNQEIDAFLDYAKAGGAVLLTAWAIRYATPMGLEDAEARQFGPVEADGIAVGVTVLKKTENLPLWDGLENIDGKPPKAEDRIQVNSTGYPKSGDYYDRIWKNFITVANAWGPPANDWTDRIAAFGYWRVGDGKVFNMNWRLPNFHKNNKSIDMLEKLTANTIEWLASESAFASVSLQGKLPVVWGKIKM